MNDSKGTVNPVDNNDLLDMLNKDLAERHTESKQDSVCDAGVDNSSDDINLTPEEEESFRNKLKELKNISENTSMSSVGTGDIDKDLERWFRGEDSIPSDALNTYVTNYGVKANYGISRATLTNFEIMNKTRKFIEGSIDVLFNESELLNLDTDSLEERLKLAFTIYERLNSLNNKTILALAEQQYKYNENNSTMDRLNMLLSSIPSEKLESILKSLMSSK
jgi:hypothetical protein